MKLGFASPLSALDSTSGASIATLRAMSMLSSCGNDCHIFCASHTDAPQELLLEEWLAESGLYYEVEKHPGFSMVHTEKDGLKIDVFRTESTRRQWIDPAEVRMFLAAFGCYLQQFDPDVLLTYGGDPVSLAMMRMTKAANTPIVFCLHNFAYTDTSTFDLVDHIVVPSEFARRHYQERLGLTCHCLPNVIDYQRIAVAEPNPKYLTFVNPQPVKGLYWFLGIAQAIASERPDIPILAVEGRRGSADLKELRNVTVMRNTPDPRSFYNVSKMILMPSLWNESFGLVAVEAMANGIPVLASNRGALPEVVGDGGCLLDIPARFTETSRIIPTRQDVAPWVDQIIHLWDDPQAYAELGEKAKRRARCFHPDILAEQYETFFGRVVNGTLAPWAD